MAQRRSLVAGIVVAVCLATSAAFANLGDTAKQFIDDLGGRAIAVFSNDATTRQQKAEAFRDLFREGFAVRSLAVFCLGRYAQNADDAFLDDYVAAFEEYIAMTYSARFASYSGEIFKVIDSKPDVDKSGETTGMWVTSEIGSAGSRDGVRVIWRLRELRGEPIIIDVVVEGVSMAVTQQKEFTAVIQRNGGEVDSLLETLNRKIEELRGA